MAKIVELLQRAIYQYREVNYGLHPKYVTISYDDYRDLEYARLRDYGKKGEIKIYEYYSFKEPRS